LLQVNVNREGWIMSVNNAWVRGLAAVANAAAPGVSAGNAVANAAAYLELETRIPPVSLGPPDGEQQVTRLDPAGISAEPLEAELMWLPVAGGEVRLVWNFQIHTADRAHVYDLTVDASSGAIWTQADWVKADSHTVYPGPAESLIHVSPVPPAVGRVVVTAPANLTASPFGWHDTDGMAGAEFTIMRGNNVHAYEDSNGSGGPPATEPDCGAGLDCNF
jgi:extracellular elastinolytic metalloproteinase